MRFTFRSVAPAAAMIRERLSPTASFLRWPRWRGLFVFGQENSSMTRRPVCSVPCPYAAPWAATSRRMSSITGAGARRTFTYGPAAAAWPALRAAGDSETRRATSCAITGGAFFSSRAYGNMGKAISPISGPRRGLHHHGVRVHGPGTGRARKLGKRSREDLPPLVSVFLHSVACI